MLFSKRDLLKMVLPMMVQQVLAITVGTRLQWRAWRWWACWILC